ncbi:MAG TPA: ATP-binding protein [Verrucomicrobiae bacterium]|jgi:signal transduction histidine kinase|nr:ATP-binding protein [Verrucomicrobiae bacterium]
MNRLMRRLLSLPKVMVLAMALVALWFIGYLDYYTGREFAVSPFYLVPICWAAWVNGRKTGFLFAIIGAETWFAADLISGAIYQDFFIGYWNTLMLFVFFLTVVYLLTAFQATSQALEKTLEQRTSALKALEEEVRERKRLEAFNLQAERLAVAGQMAAQVAHEVRNPLGSITLNLDLINKEIGRLAAGTGHSPDEGRVLLKDVREEVCRIGRVVEEYLQFARLPKSQRAPMDMNAFLKQKLGFLYSDLDRAKVKLRTQFDPAPMKINADPDQLWQVVLNLIRNSCEAMPGGGELTIATGRIGGEALLRVSDNGKGMTHEQSQQLFEPFFTTKQEGIGLGMVLVHQIVSEHGGHIECETISGKGSTFTIFLPLTKQTEMFP